jgi:hypothetical protein
MDAKQLVARYLDTWNQVNAEQRRAALAGTWAEGARYVDPIADVRGHDQISDLIGAFHQQAPGHVFRLVGDRVDAHHDVARFSWELVPATGGEPVAIGFDVVVTEDDGRIGSVLGFLDKAPAQ